MLPFHLGVGFFHEVRLANSNKVSQICCLISERLEWHFGKQGGFINHYLKFHVWLGGVCIG